MSELDQQSGEAASTFGGQERLISPEEMMHWAVTATRLAESVADKSPEDANRIISLVTARSLPSETRFGLAEQVAGSPNINLRLELADTATRMLEHGDGFAMSVLRLLENDPDDDVRDEVKFTLGRVKETEPGHFVIDDEYDEDDARPRDTEEITMSGVKRLFDYLDRSEGITEPHQSSSSFDRVLRLPSPVRSKRPAWEAQRAAELHEIARQRVASRQNGL